MSLNLFYLFIKDGCYITPISNWLFLLKASQFIRIPLYNPHPSTPLPSLEVYPLHSSPSFKVITLLQSRVSSTPKRHSHFPSKALLKVVSFLIPIPPLAIGAHTLSYPTIYVLESPHKKSLWNFSILLATWVGMVKSEKKWVIYHLLINKASSTWPTYAPFFPK